MMTTTNKLSNLQLELLKLYSFSLNEEDLREIKSLLGKYFANKLTGLVDKSVIEKNINENDLDRWLNE